MPTRLPFDPDAERAAIATLLAGDRDAVDRFAERLGCVPRMLMVRNARLGHPFTAEELDDVIQDAFVTVIRKIPEYEPRAPFESWVHGICCLQIKAALRSRARREERTGAFDPDSVAEERSPVEVLADAAEARQWLQQLGGLEAEIIGLRHFNGYTFTELGAVLELSPNTVKTHYYRGLARLRRMLQVPEGEEQERLA